MNPSFRNYLINHYFLFIDYIKSCASMEVCRQVVLTMDVSLKLIILIFLISRLKFVDFPYIKILT